MIWNTVYHITYESDIQLGDSILATLEKVGKSLSVFDKSSLVSKVNEADSMEVNNMFADVYNASLKINKASTGMFDPTISPLITAWGFGPGHTVSADSTAVDSILRFTGISKTRLQGKTLIKNDRRIQFNFSAIAKGYGCDQVAEMFKRNGVKNYLVEIGGELSIGGKSPRSDKWKISIDRPIQTDSTEIHDSSAVIAVTDCGVATSGNYRNFHKEGGKTFGHTISPVTGYPVETDVISATVIAPNCMLADGAATACMASGSRLAKEILSRLGFEGMLILSDSTIWTSARFPQIE
jgi:thiamine biosynthesis lipoprotein apbE